MEPHGVIQPLSEVRLAPACLLVQPAQVGDRGLRKALGAGRVLSGIAQAEDTVGEMAIIAKAAVTTHKGLVVPVLHELMEEGVPVHPQGPADALDTAEVGLAGPLDVEGHPVSHTAQEGDPRLILVQDL